MKKRKKKTNPKAQQKALSLFHFEYSLLVDRFLKDIGLEQGIDAFTGEFQQRIVRRHNMPQVIAAPDSVIESNQLKMANFLFKKFLEEQQVRCIPEGPTYNLAFYFTTEIDLEHSISRATPEELPNLENIRQQLKTYFDDHETKHKIVFTRVGFILESIAYSLVGDINEIYYLTIQMGIPNHELVNYNKYKTRFINFVLHLKLREEKEIFFQNEMRKAMKLSFGITNFGVHEMLIPAKELGIDSPFGSIPLPVYIQEHALIRIHERVGIKYSSEVLLDLFFAFQQPKFKPLTKGNALIEFKMSHCKVGYLKVALAEGALLVQTFLFLTNNGTPEGEKLNHLLGMQKADKKYWEIDKLSTFLESDLEENEELKQLFIRAGCKSLFDYKRGPKLSHDDKTNQFSTGIGNMLSNFLHKTQQSRQEESD